MKGGGAGGGATTTAPLQPSSRRLSQPVARGSNGQSTAAAAVGAVLTVRRQAKDALAELERRRASTPVGEGVCRARSRGASSGGGSSRDRGQQQEASLAASASISASADPSAPTTGLLAAAAAGTAAAAAGSSSNPAPSAMAGSPPPPPPSLLYAQQLSSASSSLSLDDLALVAPDYDEQDPMSPQSVFPRVRQKLREEASSSVTGAAAAAAATGPGVLSGAAGMEAADQSTDNLSLSQPSPVAVAAAAAATKKRAARPLPEIPQTVRCRTPPLAVLSACADDAARLYASFDDEVYSMHELSGGGSVVSHSNGGTPRGQAGGSGALHVFHRTAPAAVSSTGSGDRNHNHLASSTASLVTSMGAASSVGSVSTAPAAAPAASTGAGSSNSSSSGVITPLPRAAIQKSSLYELCAAFQELSRALAAMEVVAGKRARMRSEAYIIKFEHEYADLARVKNRAMKRLEALLRAGPGGTPAFAPDSAHAQVLGGVLRVVLDLDDELLLLMGTEHGTWEELKRLRGEIARHLLVLGRELGGCGCDAGGEGPASFDPLSPVPLARSLSSPTGSMGGASSGGGGGGSSVFSFAPAAVAASKRKAVVGVGRGERSGSPNSEEDMFKLRPLEASLSSLGSSSGGGGGNGGSGDMGPLSGASSSGGSIAAMGAQHQSQQQQQQGPRRPAPLQQLAPAGRGAEGSRDPESPGTMTTASLSSSTSSAFSQLSDCGGGSDEERCAPEAGGGRKGRSSTKAKAAAGAVAAASRKALSSSTGAGGAAASASASGAYHHHRSLPAPMNKSVSSDALSGLLNPLPAALTARVREKASFLHHRTLGTTGAGAGGGAGGAIPGTGSRTPLYDVVSGAAAARPRYHTTVGAGAAAGPATAGRGVSGMRPMMEAAAKS